MSFQIPVGTLAAPWYWRSQWFLVWGEYLAERNMTYHLREQTPGLVQ